MTKCVVDPKDPICGCQVEINEGQTVRILYCPMHAHTMELHGVLKSLDVNAMSDAAKVAVKNILTKTAKFEESLNKPAP